MDRMNLAVSSPLMEPTEGGDALGAQQLEETDPAHLPPVVAVRGEDDPQAMLADGIES